MMRAMGDRLPVPTRPPAPPTVFRAATSTPSLVAAVAGAAISLAAGLPAAVVVLMAVICWAVATGVVLPLRRRRPTRPPPEPARPNPYAVPQPWRDLVSEVLRSQQKFEQVVGGVRPGPLQDRMSSLGRRLEDGVQDCWTVAQRGAALNAAVSRLDPPEIHRQQVLIEAQLASPATRPDDGPLRDALAAVQAQMATVERLQSVAEDTRRQLQRLAARLGEAVAEAIELSVAEPDPTDLRSLPSGIDDVVGELETLARAVDEAGETGGDTAGGQPEAGG